LSVTGIAVQRHRVPFALVVAATWLFLTWMTTAACAQNVLSPASIFSPFVFVPALRGEFKASVIRVGIQRGKEIIPSLGISHDLRNHFHIVSENVFADVTAGIRVGRLGFRAHADTREFVGVDYSRSDPARPRAVARLEFSGIRLGADLDVFQWMGARVGINTDYCLYRPIFSEAIFADRGGKKIIGESPITAGVHFFFEPPFNVYGFSAVFETWCRWPVAGAELTDMEFSAGVRGFETVIGSMALKLGYRESSLEFPGLQIFNNLQVPTKFDVSLSGWFLELAYYY
jgi:hypothetical protein